MSARWSQEHIEGAAEAMATAREFCGDVPGALRQYRDDHNLQPADNFTLEWISYSFHQLWQTWRKDAGVRG